MLHLVRRATAALALLFAAAPALAQAPQPADPALWVVKDKDTTIYLFGTIHVLKPGLGWFDDAVKQAFDASDQVMLEVVAPAPEAMQGLILKTGVSTGGKTLTERLPPAERPAYAAALAALGLPANGFDQYDPWFAATNLTILPLLRLGYDLDSGAERVIAEAAAGAGKPVAGLETAEQQLGYLDGLSEPAQIAFLTETVKESPRIATTIETMVTDWAKGDPDALGRLMNDDLRTSPETMKTLLTDRNARWADWIAGRMATPGTVFIAVGAGHLAGPGSVQAQLAKHRLKAERVAY